MSEQDKERIEKEADEYYKNCDRLLIPYKLITKAYQRGATAENERMAELLKQERNKAIDEVIELIPIALDSNMTLSEIIKALEYLKVKANES